MALRKRQVRCWYHCPRPGQGLCCGVEVHSKHCRSWAACLGHPPTLSNSGSLLGAGGGGGMFDCSAQETVRTMEQALAAAQKFDPRGSPQPRSPRDVPAGSRNLAFESLYDTVCFLMCSSSRLRDWCSRGSGRRVCQRYGSRGHAEVSACSLVHLCPPDGLQTCCDRVGLFEGGARRPRTTRGSKAMVADLGWLSDTAAVMLEGQRGVQRCRA